jgi:response regulator baeR
MKHVLIIDDDRWFAELLAKQLRGINVDVQIAAHALEAMAAIDERPPAAIILDIFMPGPNGFVLLQELQSHSDLAQIPVIICTVSTSELRIEDAAAYGVRQILDKSTMTPQSAVAAVRKVLV